MRSTFYCHSFLKLPGLEQLGRFTKLNSFPKVQVTLMLPLFRACKSEHVTSTTVSVTTGNLIDVPIVSVQSASSPVQPSDGTFFFKRNFCKRKSKMILILSSWLFLEPRIRIS